VTLPLSARHGDVPGTVSAGRPAPLFESPSLAVSADPTVPAYELKFLLTQPQAREVEKRAAGRLEYDPHGDPCLDYAYRTTSLYCDTAGFEVFHRLGAFQRRKHRLRRYARTAAIFLERKTKWDSRVKKRRTMIPEAELKLLDHPMSLTDWSGHWFHRHLVRRALRPVCRIAYERVALVGEAAEGPLRLTFDRNVRGEFENDWTLADVDDGPALFAGQVICEFKYRAALPALFKEIIHCMQLTPSPVSKYRMYLRASGRVADRSRADA
jgi:VTC domain-containing protein